MEIKDISSILPPAPPEGSPYIVEVLASLLSICIAIIVIGTAKYIQYRDKRDSENESKLIKLQIAQWKDETKSKEEFRGQFESSQNAKFGELISLTKAHYAELRTSIEFAEREIHRLGKEIDLLKMLNELKKQ